MYIYLRTGANDFIYLNKSPVYICEIVIKKLNKIKKNKNEITLFGTKWSAFSLFLLFNNFSEENCTDSVFRSSSCSCELVCLVLSVE